MSMLGMGGGYNADAEIFGALMIVALIAAFVCTILAFVFILPEKKKKSLPKFFQFLHDVFNFNGLILEKLLKAIYIFATLYTLLANFFGIFFVESGRQFLVQLLTLILTPIVIRIVFEFCMLAILLVKNVISINKKLKNQNDDNNGGNAFDFDYSQYKMPKAPRAPRAPQAPYQNRPYNNAPASVFCPNCGTRVEGGNTFCPNCGTDVTK